MSSPKITTLRKWNTRQLIAYYSRVYGHAPHNPDRQFVLTTLVGRALRLSGDTFNLASVYEKEMDAIRVIERTLRGRSIETGAEQQQYGRKLTERQVEQIKLLKAAGVSFRKLAAQFAVNHQTIKNVTDGKHYAVAPADTRKVWKVSDFVTLTPRVYNPDDELSRWFDDPTMAVA